MAFSIATGSYTGNGSARSITGLSFQPKAVFIIGSNTNTTGTTGGGFAFDSMSLPRFVSLSDNGALTTGTVTAFNADGFSLGTSVGVNENGVSYYYTAIGGTDVYTGSYTGNATDNRAITAPNFQPEFVLLQGATDTAVWKASCSGNSTDDSSGAGTTANLSNAIQSLDATGFTIGTISNVNSNGVTYNYLAVKTLSGVSSVQYTGNGVDDRNITGFTSTPKFALIKQTSTARPASRYDSMTSGNAYIHQNGNVLSANIIQSFSSGTLQVGTDTTTNNNGSTYNAVVFGERTVNNTVFADCVGYWKLDESSGNASDATGNGYNLTNTNASYTSAVIGNGITFGTSNTNRYLSNANNMGVNGGNVTIAGWVKGNASISSSIWTLFNLGGTTTDTRYMILYDYNGGTRRLLFWRTKVNLADQGPSYTINLGTSNFYHLAITYDGTNVRGYVNGALVAGPTAASGNGIANQADVFSMGALTENGSTYSLYSNTTQDEVGVWTRSLSGSELTELYNGGVGLSFPSSVNYLLVAAQGSYTYTGYAANLLRGAKILADQGSYVLTGIAANLSRGFGIVAAVGTYALTGFDALLLAARKIVAAQGSYIYTGYAAALTKGFRLIASTGSYLMTFTGLRGWINMMKNISSWSNGGKSSSTWTNRNKSE